MQFDGGMDLFKHERGEFVLWQVLLCSISPIDLLLINTTVARRYLSTRQTYRACPRSPDQSGPRLRQGVRFIRRRSYPTSNLFVAGIRGSYLERNRTRATMVHVALLRLGSSCHTVHLPDRLVRQVVLNSTYIPRKKEFQGGKMNIPAWGRTWILRTRTPLHACTRMPSIHTQISKQTHSSSALSSSHSPVHVVAICRHRFGLRLTRPREGVLSAVPLTIVEESILDVSSQRDAISTHSRVRSYRARSP